MKINLEPNTLEEANLLAETLDEAIKFHGNCATALQATANEKRDHGRKAMLLDNMRVRLTAGG
jgi:hypothetical protein